MFVILGVLKASCQNYVFVGLKMNLKWICIYCHIKIKYSHFILRIWLCLANLKDIRIYRVWGRSGAAFSDFNPSIRGLRPFLASICALKSRPKPSRKRLESVLRAPKSVQVVRKTKMRFDTHLSLCYTPQPLSESNGLQDDSKYKSYKKTIKNQWKSMPDLVLKRSGASRDPNFSSWFGP